MESPELLTVLFSHQQHTLSCQSGVVGAYKPEQDSMVFTYGVLSLLHVWRKSRQRKSLIREQNHAVCGTEADEHAK